MRARLLAVALAAITLPVAGAAQYDPRGPPPPGSRPPSRYGAPRDSGPGPTGLVLGLRVGYGVPNGEIADDVDPTTGARLYPPLDDLVVHKIPFWLELGYRFSPTVWGDVFLELAPVRGNRDFCLSGGACDASNVRFGLDLQFHLAPYQQVDPWVGIGVGFEVLNADAFDPTANATSEFSWAGFELPLLEAGLDLAVSRRASLGPYVSWSVGQFTSYSVRTPGFADASGRLDDRAIHTWLEFGIRGALKL